MQIIKVNDLITELNKLDIGAEIRIPDQGCGCCSEEAKRIEKIVLVTPDDWEIIEKPYYLFRS